MSKPTKDTHQTTTSASHIATLTPPTSALFVADNPIKQNLQRGLILGGVALAIFSYIVVSTLAVVVDIPLITDDNGQPYPVRATILVGLITIMYSFIARHYITENTSKKWSAQYGTEDVSRAWPFALSGRTFGYIALATLLGWGIGQIIAHTCYALFGSSNFDSVSASFSSDRVFLVLILAVLIAPVSEEMLMRGVIYPLLRFRFSAYVACIITACVFGLLHGNAIQFVVTIPLSILTAWVYELTRDVTYCAAMHMLFNATAMIIPVSWITELNPVVLAIFVLTALPLLGLGLRSCIRRVQQSYISDHEKTTPTTLITEPALNHHKE